jgi:DNA-binding NarL/FixJ family response regulator
MKILRLNQLTFMQTGQIWLIDKDTEDHDIVREVLHELSQSNELVVLNSAEEAVSCLEAAEESPFIIISELNLPGISGFELRKKLLESNSKKLKSVPFIFWATQASEAQITHAYDLAVHGFFIKEGSFSELKETFGCIINYWLKSKMPSKSGKT